jgi:hypothetical protein
MGANVKRNRTTATPERLFRTNKQMVTTERLIL